MCEDAALLVDPHGLGDDVAGGHARVERRVGILEDHLHVLAGGDQVLGLELGEVLALEDDLAGGGPVELGDGAGGRGLAAAGLADEAEGLALLDLEVDAVDRVDVALLAAQEAAPEGEVHLEVLDVEQGFVRRPWLLLLRIQPAADGPAVVEGLPGRVLALADVHRLVAAGIEGAAVGQVDDVRRLAPDGGEPLAALRSRRGTDLMRPWV